MSHRSHFTPELFTFLRQLKRNNNREWFNKHKSRYIEVVRDPMLAFIEDFAPRLAKLSPHLVADPRPVGGSMFRIYRDTRFANDKTPYKTACTARFPHERAKDVHGPGYYIHLGVDGVYAGAGIWHPDGPSLAKIRKHLVAEPAAWKRIVNGKAFKDGPLNLTGDTLKRPPRGFDPDHPLIDDIKRKDFVSMTELDEKTACSKDFLTQYTKLCRQSLPFVKYLGTAVGAPI